MPRDLALPPVLLEQLRLPKHRYSNRAAAEPYRLARWSAAAPWPCDVALKLSQRWRCGRRSVESIWAQVDANQGDAQYRLAACDLAVGRKCLGCSGSVNAPRRAAVGKDAGTQWRMYTSQSPRA
jgi:hypothetical protein